jgi:hypothetical protein
MFPDRNTSERPWIEVHACPKLQLFMLVIYEIFTGVEANRENQSLILL